MAILHDHSTKKEYDFCIVGAGVSGITLALELSKLGHSVSLNEGGLDTYSSESQNMYHGKVIGDKYAPITSSRLRFLGGSSNHWGGMSRTLEEMDFDRSEVSEHIKWPFSKHELDPYLKDAQKILNLSDIYTSESINNSQLRFINFEWAKNRAVNFKSKYFNILKSSRLIDLSLDSNLVDCATKNKKISGLLFRPTNSGNIYQIKAKNFIFCMGGIENARLMLWLRELHGEDFCSHMLPIGKYFMEHPHLTVGEVVFFKPFNPPEGYFCEADNFVNLALNEKTIRAHKILNAGIRIRGLKAQKTKEIVKELICHAPNIPFQDSRNEWCAKQLQFAYEQEPNSKNKVELDRASKDNLGIPRVILDNRQTKLDFLTLNTTFDIFNSWLLENNIGRIKKSKWLIDKNINFHTKYPMLEFAGHHMGTTRMSNSFVTGVVDKDCKVHGCENLYVGGSSVFPTGGHTNPTITIVQLSLRLAMHFKKEMH